MIEIKTHIIINTEKKQLWDVFTRFQEYPLWNTFFQYISGALEKNSRLFVKLVLPGKKPMIVKPKVVTIKKEKELRWVGKVIHTRLLKAEHYFILEPMKEGKIKFIHGEKFTGLLTPFLKIFNIHKKTQEAFNSFNKELKRRVEEAGENSFK